MGCGSSKSDSSVLVVNGPERDPDDFSLEPVNLLTCHIPDFDAVFLSIEERFCQLVGLNNGINDGVAAVKAAHATLTGSLVLQTSTAASTDWLLLDLFLNQEGSPRPSGADVWSLLEREDVREADRQLDAARDALHQHMRLECEAAAVSMLRADAGNRSVRVALPAGSSPDAVLPTPPQQLSAFNDAMAALQALLTNRFRLCVYVRPTSAAGTETVCARLMKHVDGGAEAGERTRPATLLDVCATLQVGGIKEAEACLVEQAQLLAMRTKSLADVDWQVVVDHRVDVVIASAEAELHAKVRKLVQGTNTSLFRLMNLGTMCHGTSRMQDAVVHIAQALVTLMSERQQQQQLSQPMKDLMSINPEVHFGQADGEAPTFDFRFNVDFKDDTGMPPFPECLPEKAALLHKAVVGLTERVVQALSQLPQISDEVAELLDKAKDFYELASEAAASQGMSMMDAVKSAKAVSSNLKAVFEANQLFHFLGDNVKRVADDLGAARAHVDQMLGA